MALAPFRSFTVDEWSALRGETPLTLTEDDLARIQSLNDTISLAEVAKVYLPLSRLLALHVDASKALFSARQKFLGEDRPAPFILGIAGSVAVGKSTIARLLQRLLTRWPTGPRVDLVTTDGFLFPNARLERDDLMARKGFPESYDLPRLLRFLSQLKAGEGPLHVPRYSHLAYDVDPYDAQEIARPDILILEGLNVLQCPTLPADGKAVPFVSDFFDFSIYFDADERDIERWYIERFMRLRSSRFRDPASYFHKYADCDDQAATDIARDLWTRINLRNLRENILPTRPRATLILRKGRDHAVEEVALRKL